MEYPPIEKIRDALLELTGDVTFINATDEAMKLGQPILGNVIMIGALAGAGVIPFDTDDFRTVITETMPPDRIDMNLKAFARGKEMAKQAGRRNG